MRLIAILTVLSLAPGILVVVTSFTRIVVVMSLLRSALGLQQTPPNQVLMGIALFMTFFVMSPVLSNVYTNAYEPYMADEITQQEALDNGIKPFRAFMLSNVGDKELSLFMNMGK